METEIRHAFEQLLICALNGEAPRQLPSPEAWPELIEAFHQHKVEAIVFEAVRRSDDVPDWVKDVLMQPAQEAARQSYHLLFAARYLTGELEKAGISVAVLKGSAVSRYYPVPEMRKSGDIDLLLTDAGQLDDAREVFRRIGLTLETEQHGSHHLEWATPEKLSVELHTRLIELVNRDEADRCIARQGAATPLPLPRATIMGVSLPVLPQCYDAYHLLLHMVQHFLGAGFGVRLLCDWVRFWNRQVPSQETADFLRLVHEAKLDGFLQLVTSVCVRRLGLTGCDGGLIVREDCVSFTNGSFCDLLADDACAGFLGDVYKGGDFGGGEQGRMITVEGSGVWAYIREFHRQMRKSYAKASKCNLLWPVLWVLTFVTFLRNNRRLNRGSLWSILKKTKQRTSLLEDEIKLFQ